jgi:hypothetical protein
MHVGNGLNNIPAFESLAILVHGPKDRARADFFIVQLLSFSHHKYVKLQVALKIPQPMLLFIADASIKSPRERLYSYLRKVHKSYD